MSLSILWFATETHRLPEGGDEYTSDARSINIDIVTSESGAIGADVTNHPMDEGSPVSDHVRPRLDMITVECMHSDSPSRLDTDDVERSDVTLSSGASVNVLQYSGDQSRSLTILEQLEELCKAGTEIYSIGLKRDVEGWVITDVAPNRETINAGALEFSITMQEIRKADTQEVAAPSPRVERGRRRRDRGRQRPQNTGSTSTVSNSPTTTNRQSALSSILDGLGAFNAQQSGGGS